MPTLEVGPYAVTSGAGTPGIVAGSAPPGGLLADHADDSYVDLTTLYAKPFDSAWYRIDRVNCPIVVTLPAGATNVIYQKAMVRASATDPASSPGGTRLSVTLADPSFTEAFDLNGAVGTQIPADGSVHDIDLDTVYAYGSGTVLDLLTSGDAIMYLSVFTPPGGADDPNGHWTNTARVYEAFVYVTYDLATAEAPRLRRVPIAPVRRVPAEKWRGSSTRRAGGYD